HHLGLGMPGTFGKREGHTGHHHEGSHENRRHEFHTSHPLTMCPLPTPSMGSAHPTIGHFNKGICEKSSVGFSQHVSPPRSPLHYPPYGIHGRRGGQSPPPETALRGHGPDVIDDSRHTQ